MINIYTESGIKGPKKRDGFSIYILETVVKAKKFTKAGDGGQMILKDETLTLTKGMKLLNMSENQSQLFTLLDAMKRIQKPGELTIHITSEWLHTGITEWIEKWQLSEWKTAKGDDVQFIGQWQDLDRLLKQNQITFEVGTRHHYKDWMLSELEKRNKERNYVREIWRNEFIY